MRSGDGGAYDELHRRHVAAVRRYAGNCCLDAEAAEDLTNEVFARLLHTVRRGAGPDTAVRAYLLATVRRVAATWTDAGRRKRLVEDFAVFAMSAAGVSADDRAARNADVRAMREAERSMVVRAFRGLPERWQTVLWHTSVERESPQEVAPLLGITADAAATLAHRAREGLRQAYLQAHAAQSLRTGGGCARHADRLDAYARGGLRSRVERGLRAHLDRCVRCRTTAEETTDLDGRLRALLPLAVVGWFAASDPLGAARAAAAAETATGPVASTTAGAATGTTAGAAGAANPFGSGTAVFGVPVGAAADGQATESRRSVMASAVVAAVAATLVLILVGDVQGPPATKAAAPPPSESVVSGAEPERGEGARRHGTPTVSTPLAGGPSAHGPSSPSAPASASGATSEATPPQAPGEAASGSPEADAAEASRRPESAPESAAARDRALSPEETPPAGPPSDSASPPPASPPPASTPPASLVYELGRLARSVVEGREEPAVPSDRSSWLW